MDRRIGNLSERIMALFFQCRTNPVDDSDGFVRALGRDPEDFRETDGGIDFLAALDDTARRDWTWEEGDGRV